MASDDSTEKKEVTDPSAQETTKTDGDTTTTDTAPAKASTANADAKTGEGDGETDKDAGDQDQKKEADAKEDEKRADTAKEATETKADDNKEENSKIPAKEETGKGEAKAKDEAAVDAPPQVETNEASIPLEDPTMPPLGGSSSAPSGARQAELISKLPNLNAAILNLKSPTVKRKGEVLKRPQDATTVVTRNGKTWNEMFDCLVEYKEKNGSTMVPDRFKTQDGVCLGLWVRNQRRRRETLSEEQRKRLTDLGLDWQTQNERFDSVWHERYARLTEYRLEHGDCKVPYTYKADPALAKWVSQQRAQQAQGRLDETRKKKLDAIDFSWKLNVVKNRNTKTEDAKWQRQFEKLLKFKEEHGHCRVPDRYQPDRPLGTWVKKQRLANACGQLKPERKEDLEKVGFVWRITDKTDGEKWDAMFQQLVEYKDRHGTCHVSRTVPDNDLKPLARWVKTQRALYKSGKILPNRKDKLESINFVWDGLQLDIKRKRRRSSHDALAEEQNIALPAAKRARPEGEVSVAMPSVPVETKPAAASVAAPGVIQENVWDLAAAALAAEGKGDGTTKMETEQEYLAKVATNGAAAAATEAKVVATNGAAAAAPTEAKDDSKTAMESDKKDDKMDVEENKAKESKGDKMDVEDEETAKNTVLAERAAFGATEDKKEEEDADATEDEDEEVVTGVKSAKKEVKEEEAKKEPEPQKEVETASPARRSKRHRIRRI